MPGSSLSARRLQLPAFTHQNLLLTASLAVYLLVRLAAIADYPVYFFTDEAVQTVLAADFLRDGLRNYAGELLPAYFLNVYQYNLSVSVYLQIIPYLLFGKSVEVTRGAAALATLIAALGVGLSLRHAFGSRRPWLGVLALSLLPAWFLHSRTAFETSLAVSFYAAFLYFYLHYRQGSRRSLFFAIGMAALAFYSYAPAQMVVLVTALLLFFSDLRLHLRQPRRAWLAALGAALLLALPYLRFQLTHPGESLKHLAQIGSYWAAPVPPLEKLGAFFARWLSGLNPLYWFLPNPVDLPRHQMDGYGHLLWISLPFVALGLAIALRRFRQGEYRVLLAALLAAPSGAALAELGITRALFMVVPAALLAALGLEAGLDWLPARFKPRPALFEASFFLLLAGFNLFLLGDALANGPTWSTNYGLQGMQYGARQVFGEALRYKQQHPQARIILSPTWANGTDVLARFLWPDPPPGLLDGINSYLDEKRSFPADTVFVLPPEEYERARQSGKFTDIRVEQTLPWPDGRPGFYFVRMRYADNIDELFSAELEQRHILVPALVELRGVPVQVYHSPLDMGEIRHIADSNLNTLVRTKAANPLKLQLDFDSPQRMRALGLHIGGTASTIELTVQVLGEPEPRRLELKLGETPLPRTVELDFGEELAVESLFLRLKNTNDPEPGHVHLWEVGWR